MGFYEFPGDPTGQTDVRAQIAAALASHGMVICPPGDFLIGGGANDWLSIGANQHLVGAARGLTRFLVRGPERFITAVNANSTSLHNFSVDMGGTLGSAAIYFAGVSPKARISNVAITNGDSGISVEPGSDGFQIVDCDIDTMAANGLVITGSAGVSVRNNNLARIGRSAIQLFTCDKPFVFGNRASSAGINNGYGGLRCCEGCTDLQAAWNSFTGFSHGIFTIGQIFGLIDHNSIDGSLDASIFIQAKNDDPPNRVSQVVQITNNNIKNGAPGTVGVWLDRRGDGQTFCAEHVLFGNTITAQSGPMAGGFRDTTASRPGDAAMWGGGQNYIDRDHNKVNGCPFNG